MGHQHKLRLVLRQYQAVLPTLSQRLQDWADKYSRLLDVACLRSALRGKLSRRQYRDGEHERVRTGYLLVKYLLAQLSRLKTFGTVLEFPSGPGHYTAYPGDLAVHSVATGFDYVAADGVQDAVDLTERRTRRSFKKAGQPFSSVRFITATHEDIADHFRDGELVLTFIFELTLHLELFEIYHLLTKLKRKTRKGGIILISLTSKENNFMVEFDEQRTYLHPRQAIIKMMRPWRPVFIPSYLANALFFARQISQLRLPIHPEHVEYVAFMKPEK